MDDELHGLRNTSVSGALFMIPFAGFSMYPFFRPGDRLVVRRHPSKAIKVGDVILFRGNGEGLRSELIAHRVIEMRADGWILTKGDNLPRPDKTLERGDQILGLVTFVVRKGRMIPLIGGGHSLAARWIAFLSRRNLTPGILMAKAKDLMGIKR